MCWYRKSDVVDTMSCSIDQLENLAYSCYSKFLIENKTVITIGAEISVIGGLMLNAFWVHVDRYGFYDDTGG